MFPWLSWATEVFLCLIKVCQHYLLEIAATGGAQVVKVLILTWPSWPSDHMVVHSLRNCQKCPNLCSSVTCFLKDLRSPSMNQVFVAEHTRFDIKRAHLEGLRESSESRARILFCLSCIIEKNLCHQPQHFWTCFPVWYSSGYLFVVYCYSMWLVVSIEFHLVAYNPLV